MRDLEQSAMELSEQGGAFAVRQALLSKPTDLKQFQQQTLITLGSAFALAQYADEQARSKSVKQAKPSPGIERLQGNTRLLRSSAMEIQSSLRLLIKLPFARAVTGRETPRIVGVAQGYLNAATYLWGIPGLSSFLLGFQATEPLGLRELWALPIALKLVLLEEILAQAAGAFTNLPASDDALNASMLCLHEVSLPVWSNILEPLVPFEPILREDPAQAYARMDFESRDQVRTALSKIAARSHWSEVEIARLALEMARDAAQRPNANPRVTERCSHIGYYIVDNGAKELKTKCGFRPGMRDRVRSALHSYPDDFYLGGIQTITLVTIALIVIPLVPRYSPLGALAFAFLFLLLPVSQGAVELVNHTITAILKPQALLKLDFTDGVPEDCKTLVAVPTLLLNEEQVRDLVSELEVRSLANQDPNIHYALVTDLPDSVAKPQDRDAHPLVLLAGQLIEDLNRRYDSPNCGGFLMLHRHRVFNPRQGVWMGWERKRGKLLDLNRLVMGGMDCFPFKAGDVSVLPGMRYVLTLDSDTKLPRDSVRRMIGAMAHPLNQAILDPRRRIVTQGYGILQPRVGITVKSVARSRLAAIYSGQTGFDIYTRAISDVYQDLYGEGIFTGKGLYEIQILHEVLDRRFPQNFLLSHDLIEGAYARAGLLTDVEVMDDYPSHYSAQNRRKHRWVRGDWQILRWLLRRVPNESGQLVINTTSTISRWKILDNLRRSLVEPATFLLLVFGWLWLPGTPAYWTVVTLLVVFVPVFVQFLFSIVRASVAEQGGYVRQSIRDSLGLLFSTALNFAFLSHQTLLMLDAIFRSLVRSFVTGERLLEWETAAEAELGSRKQTPVEVTMRLVPFLSLAVALLVWWIRPSGLRWAIPILLLWALAKPITQWLNRSPHDLEQKLSAKDVRFLRKVAWRTWLYFVRYLGEHNHGLVPDNVQEEGQIEASRISPTNAGLQLNARQAAVVLGYLTIPEFAEQTLANLHTLDQIPKFKGHLLNWYTTTTLDSIKPWIASSVDSGNLIASLCSLTMGMLELLRTPFLANLREGLLDIVLDVPNKPKRTEYQQRLQAILQSDKDDWFISLLALPVGEPAQIFTDVRQRIEAVRGLIQFYLPWLQPESAEVLKGMSAEEPSPSSFTPESALRYCRLLREQLREQRNNKSEDHGNTVEDLDAALGMAEQNLSKLIADLQTAASISERMFSDTDFRIMLDPYRRLLTIGYDTENERQLNSCYDLLASEARTAMFLAIGKGDVLQQTWFRVARKTTLVDGQAVLLSWSGTMFEYMMPSLWMQTSPETLLAQSLPMVVEAQRKYIGRRRMPWGISESSHSERDKDGNYQYHAFGVPTLAINPPPEGFLVIAPYASVLALEAGRSAALANMYAMEKAGWLGECGFYESADYSSNVQHPKGSNYTLVRSWMAHHQGMSLLSITNLLADKPFQRWFHSDPRVKATELLLHEKPAQITPEPDAPQFSRVSFKPAKISS